MKRLIIIILALISISFCINKTSFASTRLYTITYNFSLDNKLKNKSIDIWMPFPPELKEQSVIEVKIKPKDISKDLRYNSIYGTPILHIKARNKRYIKVTYVVLRKELKTSKLTSKQIKTYNSHILFKQFTFIPSDPIIKRLIHQMALKITKHDLNEMDKVHDIYKFIIDYLKYGHIPGSGKGNLAWLFKTREGSCVDYHSLFMALCSQIDVPTLFEIGILFPPNKISGIVTHYHSWVKFFVPKIGWIPVDVSEADKHPQLRKYYFGNLTSNRITLSLGRWLKVAGNTINFFTKPIVKIGKKEFKKYKLTITYSCKSY